MDTEESFWILKSHFGYRRVIFDTGESFWIPESHFGYRESFWIPENHFEYLRVILDTGESFLDQSTTFTGKIIHKMGCGYLNHF